MEKMDIFKQNNNRGMAKRTFKDKMTIGSGADQIDLYYFGPGHTNGDAWVVFPAHRIVHSGDIFAGKGVPLIDGNNGGSMLHYSESLMKAYNGIKNVDTIINGHTPANTAFADLKEFADFNKDLLTWAQGELKAGKTPEQAAAEWKLPEKYKGYSGTEKLPNKTARKQENERRAAASEGTTSVVATYSGGSGSPARPTAARKASRRSRPTPCVTPGAPLPIASDTPTYAMRRSLPVGWS